MFRTRISSRLAGLQCAMAQIITLGPVDYNIQYGDWTGFSKVTSIRIMVTLLVAPISHKALKITSTNVFLFVREHLSTLFDSFLLCIQLAVNSSYHTQSSLDITILLNIWQHLLLNYRDSASSLSLSHLGQWAKLSLHVLSLQQPAYANWRLDWARPTSKLSIL